MAVTTDTELAASDAAVAEDLPASPGDVGSGGSRAPLVMGTAAAVYVLATALVASSIDTSTTAGRVLWAVMPIPATGTFVCRCALLAGRCTGQRRRFWVVLTLGIGFLFVGQVWRAAALAMSLPTDLLEAVYAAMSTAGIFTFMSALVIRLRMVAPATWGVQYLDAGAVGVVVSTVLMLPVADELGSAPVDVYFVAMQPVVLMMLASGSAGALFTPVPWRGKRTDAVLVVALTIGFIQALVEMYAVIRHADRFPPLSLVLLTAAFAVATFATTIEIPRAPIAVLNREDYDSAAWPYLLLGVLPVLALWKVVAGTLAEQVFTVAALLVGFVVAVFRQLQILRTQRIVHENDLRLTEEVRQDTASARALLAVSRDLSVAADRTEAQAAVIGALRAATRAANVRIIETDGTVSGDSVVPGAMGPEALVVLATGDGRLVGSEAPWSYHDPVAGVSGLLAPAVSPDDRLVAVLCLDGARWKPTPLERDLVAGLAQQLAVALERAVLLGRLAEVETRYRQVIDNLPVGIVEVRNDDVVVRTNASFDSLAELAAAEVVGRHIWDAFESIETDPPSAISMFDELGELQFKARVVTKRGTERVVEVDTARIDRRDRSVGTVAVIRDVTTQTRLRRRIRHAAKEIEANADVPAQSLPVLSARALLLLDEALVTVRNLQFGHTQASWGAARDSAVRSLDGAISEVRAVAGCLGSDT